MNHLALAAPDAAASAAFYQRYFGFEPMGPAGMLRGPTGFILSIDQVPAPVVVPTWFHQGFTVASSAELDALHDRLVADGIPIADPPRTQGRTVVFFCRDPAGLLVEVRAPAP